MPLIGLDIGTTGCKAILFSEDGNILASASHEYSIEIPHPGWAEQDIEKVWKLAEDTLRQVIKNAGHPSVTAIGLSVQGEAIVPVNARGQVLRPAILGMDTRTATQNRWLMNQFGGKGLFQKTGMPIHTINTLPKLLWIRENEPETWHSAKHFYLYEDYFINKLTGHSAISQCLASRTQLFDLHQKHWAPSILEVIDLPVEKLSLVYQSGYPVAPLKPDLARSMGIPNRPVVTTGGHDQACGALGVGLTRPGLAMVSTGTAEVVEIALDKPVLSDSIFQANLSCYCHVIPDLYLMMTLNHSGGLLLRWYRDTFCQEEVHQAQHQGIDAYDMIIGDPNEALNASPQPMLVLPHFAGSGTPAFDVTSRGAIVGLTFAARKQDIARAIVEGLTYELNINLEILRQSGVRINELRAIGGGARSKFWLQLKADITGTPVVRPAITEAACWGAALLAGQGAGLYPNAAQMVEKSVQWIERYTPDPIKMAAHQAHFHLYQQLYPVLKPINTRL